MIQEHITFFSILLYIPLPNIFKSLLSWLRVQMNTSGQNQSNTPQCRKNLPPNGVLPNLRTASLCALLLPYSWVYTFFLEKWNPSARGRHWALAVCKNLPSYVEILFVLDCWEHQAFIPNCLAFLESKPHTGQRTFFFLILAHDFEPDVRWMVVEMYCLLTTCALILPF